MCLSFIIMHVHHLVFTFLCIYDFIIFIYCLRKYSQYASLFKMYFHGIY